LAKWRVQCFLEAKVLNRSSGIFINFGAEKPPLRQAAGRYVQAFPTIGKFKNLTQQNINYIFAALWKKHTNDYPIKRGL